MFALNVFFFNTGQAFSFARCAGVSCGSGSEVSEVQTGMCRGAAKRDGRPGNNAIWNVKERRKERVQLNMQRVLHRCTTEKEE